MTSPIIREVDIIDSLLLRLLLVVVVVVRRMIMTIRMYARSAEISLLLLLVAMTKITRVHRSEVTGCGEVGHRSVVVASRVLI